MAGHIAAPLAKVAKAFAPFDMADFRGILLLL